jgi:hypothetical protein
VDKKKLKLIGLSLSACLSDIENGFVNIDNVMYIRADINPKKARDFQTMFPQLHHNKKFLMIICDLISQSKILLNLNPTDIKLPKLHSSEEFGRWIDADTGYIFDLVREEVTSKKQTIRYQSSPEEIFKILYGTFHQGSL